MTVEEQEIVVKAIRLLNAGSLEWSEAGEHLTAAAMAKYSNCVRNKKNVPHSVFETHNRGTKTVNSDIAIFDPKGRIYLVGREPGQLWADTIHLPGTTHAYEWLQEATERLLATELKNFSLKYSDLKRVEVLELQDEPRAMCQSNLFTTWIETTPAGTEEKFFAKDSIPWNQVVFSHRTVTLPWFIEHGYL